MPAEGVVKGAFRFQLIVWAGFFSQYAVVMVLRFWSWLAQQSYDVGHALSAFAIPFCLGVYSGCSVYKTVVSTHYRMVSALGAGLVCAGAAHLVADFWRGVVPVFDIALLGVLFIYSTLVGTVLFQLIWSARVVLTLILSLKDNGIKANTRAILRTSLGGALMMSASATIAILAGANIGLVLNEWFYVLALPAAIGMGFTGPRPRKPSAIFAGLIVICAASVALSVLPGYQRRHSLFCAGDRTPEHKVLGFTREPWGWRNPRSVKEWLIAPVALAELTIWHVAAPVTEKTC